jgi:hypothetical protein
MEVSAQLHVLSVLSLWITGWVGPRAVPDDRGKKSWPYQDSNSNPLVVQTVASLWEQNAVSSYFMKQLVK